VTARWLATADGMSPWPQVHVVVAGIGVSGFAAADGLLEFGARVTVLDDGADDVRRDKATLLETLGATVRLGPGSTATLPGDADLVITTGWPATAPLLMQAAAREIPIWSEVELAWRLSRPAKIVPWLGITGTNGKTTTTQMLESMLTAAGLRTAAVGNIGRPIMEIVLDPSRTTCWPSSCPAISCTGPTRWPCIRQPCSTCSPITCSGTVPTRPTVTRRPRSTPESRPVASTTSRTRPPSRWWRRPRWSKGPGPSASPWAPPGLSMVGVVDDLLVDRAFIEQRRDSALELAKISDISPGGAAQRRERPRRRRPGPLRTGCRRSRSATGCGR
jgi:UDP-N-acetylmuramoylalanine--D-glutamate ligase